MKVKAINGVKVPFEHRPHQYIEQEVVEVENSVYYQRRIADGDLIKVEEPHNKKTEKGAK